MSSLVKLKKPSHRKPLGAAKSSRYLKILAISTILPFLLVGVSLLPDHLRGYFKHTLTLLSEVRSFNDAVELLTKGPPPPPDLYSPFWQPTEEELLNFINSQHRRGIREAVLVYYKMEGCGFCTKVTENLLDYFAVVSRRVDSTDSVSAEGSNAISTIDHGLTEEEKPPLKQILKNARLIGSSTEEKRKLTMLGDIPIAVMKTTKSSPTGEEILSVPALRLFYHHNSSDASNFAQSLHSESYNGPALIRETPIRLFDWLYKLDFASKFSQTETMRNTYVGSVSNPEEVVDKLENGRLNGVGNARIIFTATPELWPAVEELFSSESVSDPPLESLMSIDRSGYNDECKSEEGKNNSDSLTAVSVSEENGTVVTESESNTVNVSEAFENLDSDQDSLMNNDTKLFDPCSSFQLSRTTMTTDSRHFTTQRWSFDSRDEFKEFFSANARDRLMMPPFSRLYFEGLQLHVKASPLLIVTNRYVKDAKILEALEAVQKTLDYMVHAVWVNTAENTKDVKRYFGFRHPTHYPKKNSKTPPPPPKLEFRLFSAAQLVRNSPQQFGKFLGDPTDAQALTDWITETVQKPGFTAGPERPEKSKATENDIANAEHKLKEVREALKDLGVSEEGGEADKETGAQSLKKVQQIMELFQGATDKDQLKERLDSAMASMGLDKEQIWKDFQTGKDPRKNVEEIGKEPVVDLEASDLGGA